MRLLPIIFTLCFHMAAFAAGPALDSSKPINITADELEVRQQDKRAIFSGNVIAKQGNITMQSARMAVFYDDAAANKDGATQISRIEADGGVFFTTPVETAQGARAVYDVSAERIRMMGNVTLTRDQSVVKGEGLLYNLKTGRSVLSSSGSKTQGSKERVRGLFVPGSKETQ